MNAYRSLAFALLLSLLSAAAPAQSDPMPAKCAELLNRWKDKFAEEKLTALVAPPFVIAGDGAQDRLESFRDHTVLAAMRCLQAQFFDKKPTEPILILLFESEKPYRRLARKWFNDTNVAYYGY